MVFYNLAKEYCPKVTMFHLSKKDEETTKEEDKPWDNVKPISGIYSEHVAWHYTDVEATMFGGSLETFEY